MRVCNEPGCPELVDKGKCPTHSRQREQQRGTREERGYDYRHRQLRKAWAQKVAGGRINCWRCGERISPLADWDLGHDDLDRSITRGPECITCNRGTATRA